MDEIVKIFEEMGAENYDNFNSHFRTAKENLHFLNTLIFKNIPEKSNVLCIGVGTGEEIISLAQSYPNWNFVGIDPSKAMLQGCQEKVELHNLSDRCHFFHGYLSDYKPDLAFDAVTCLFVMHFIHNQDERLKMLSDMNKHLKKGGYLINAEISCDFNSNDFPNLLENWKALHRYAGAPEEKLESMENTLKEQLAVLSPQETEKLLLKSGFANPTQFFQSFLIRAWYSKKPT